MINNLSVIQLSEESINIPTLDQVIVLVEKNQGCFLFTSPDKEFSHIRWIVGLNPIITHFGENIQTIDGLNIEVSPLEGIDEIIEQSTVNPECPLWLGYIGWDFKDRLEEPGLFARLSDILFPPCSMSIYHRVIVIDFQTQSAILYTLALKNTIKQFPPIILKTQDIPTHFNISNLTTNKTREQFMADVEKIQEYIRAGDIYQANLTRKIETIYQGSKLQIVKNLLESNTIEFGAFLNTKYGTVVSTSPERFFKVEGRRISTFPIKGTAPRSNDVTSDQVIADDLLSDTKNRRELAMIVDLLRNDLSRICKPGTVIVENFPQLLTLNNVFHLLAGIVGELEEISFEKIIYAMFPGGSISGCPKIRAIQIIEEIEQIPRGIYTGTLGYIKKNHSMDFNILIRTVMISGNKLWFNVGGGITLLSNPEQEYEETCHKAKNILNALQKK
ncbi:MAG TPA: anthranilate synthase component I family protein [Salinivirgaceae bacterium]|nr:anthranilate synthase component I family protein [Salinivirgaceae bacterium]